MRKRSKLRRADVVALLCGAAVQAGSLAVYDLASGCSLLETLARLFLPLLPFVILGVPAVWFAKMVDSGARVVLFAAGLILAVYTVWFQVCLWREYPPPGHLEYQDFAPVVLFGLESVFSLVAATTSVGVGLFFRARSRSGHSDVAS
jgi:uncharacterized membrane protein YfcA